LLKVCVKNKGIMKWTCGLNTERRNAHIFIGGNFLEGGCFEAQEGGEGVTSR
jgi:hypothetical protein